ncbi:MAG TPA: DUF3093 domain-containing protein [Microlunatus sp.]|nr:DUF3093 domain-containing protein [Microlunatus sp.]
MRFRERLTPPPLWWVIAAIVALTFPVAVLFYLGPAWALGTLVVAAALVLIVLWGWAAIRIRFDGEWLRVGRAQIELRYLSGARALDAERTRARCGVDADARAYLVLRPYVATAVEITLDDPDDPVPYWLISTRRPRALAAVLSDALSSRVTG